MKEPILNAGLVLQAAVLGIHLVGGVLGYAVPKKLGYGETTCRTMVKSDTHGNTTRAPRSSLLRLGVASRRIASHRIASRRPPRLHRPSPPSLPQAIETSMKSSAFGFLLAKLHFTAFLTRVPSAVSVVWMAVTGSSLAVFWKYQPVDEAAQAGKK